MTIKKGETWGRPTDLTGDESVATTDAEITERWKTDHSARVVVRGGDLLRSLGGRPSGATHEFPIDLLHVQTDLGEFWAAAHVVARGRRWSGRFVVAMNSTHLGRWNLGPRAHPDDGIVDITDGSLRAADRWKAWRRAPSGSHVPHPRLEQVRVRRFTTRFAPPRILFVDGVERGRVGSLDITVHADEMTIVV